MKKRFGAVLDILILSINYILISYALSNLTYRLQHHWLFILFFASEVWMTALYWEQVRKKTGCKCCPTEESTEDSLSARPSPTPKETSSWAPGTA